MPPASCFRFRFRFCFLLASDILCVCVRVRSASCHYQINNMSQYSNTEHPEFPPSKAFAPWDMAQAVCLYPSILDPRASQTDGGSTSMVDHFVA